MDPRVTGCETLDDLLALLRQDIRARIQAEADAAAAGEPCEYEAIDWSALPTYGGTPISGAGVWSYDPARVLRGSDETPESVGIIARTGDEDPA